MASLGLDNFHVESDNDSDDPFASPPRESLTKKRKEPDSGLGIDKEVSIQKRARVPNVKLDEERLLGPMGIPKLKARAAALKLKGKGHEFSDAARLLSLYQLWLDDLFPKARFLDALAMVEKAGHKKKLQVARQEWISQGRPKAAEEEEDDAAVDVVAQSSRNKTPVRDRAADDDDLYGATPRARRAVAAVNHVRDEVNDLEALMAEAELAADQAPEGDGDLEAFMAEAEELDRARTVGRGIAADVSERAHDYADDEAAMQEMEGLW